LTLTGNNSVGSPAWQPNGGTTLTWGDIVCVCDVISSPISPLQVATSAGPRTPSWWRTPS